jgi:hypothetical protein
VAILAFQRVDQDFTFRTKSMHQILLSAPLTASRARKGVGWCLIAMLTNREETSTKSSSKVCGRTAVLALVPNQQETIDRRFRRRSVFHLDLLQTAGPNEARADVHLNTSGTWLRTFVTTGPYAPVALAQSPVTGEIFVTTIWASGPSDEP